jgi:hypothetical protein
MFSQPKEAVGRVEVGGIHGVVAVATVDVISSIVRVHFHGVVARVAEGVVGTIAGLKVVAFFAPDHLDQTRARADVRRRHPIRQPRSGSVYSTPSTIHTPDGAGSREQT